MIKQLGFARLAPIPITSLWLVLPTFQLAGRVIKLIRTPPDWMGGVTGRCSYADRLLPTQRHCRDICVQGWRARGFHDRSRTLALPFTVRARWKVSCATGRG
jgi:hypothetical protein